MTYTADAGYDDDFDDEDFGSEKSNTPDRQPSPSSNTEARHNFLESNSYDELNERSQKLVDVPNMSPQGSAKTVTREGKETKSTGNEGISSRHQGRNSQAPSSIGKTSRKLPYSHRRSVRSTRNGFSRMSTTTRQLDIGDLRHEMRVIGEEIEALKLENKSLKRNNVLLTHQLDKREKEEQEVPNVYDRHVKEVRALKDQLRRQQERYDKVHYRLRRTEKNLATSQKEEAELERVAAECELKERSRLRKHLEKIEQENQLCDEKIRQLEKYVEHLDRCHEAELSAEEEKRKETQAIIERLLEETQMAKQSIQAKETELERFKLQRTNRLTMSRALNTGMSGQLSAICESRSDTYVGHLKALPAPPTKETLEMTPANEHHELTPARGSQQVTPAKASKEVKNAKDRFRVNNKQNRVKVTPSPPATSHPNPNSQRSNRAKDSMVKHLTMTAGGKVSGSVTPSIGYDKNSKVGEEEKKAELPYDITVSPSNINMCSNRILMTACS
ncbi:lebercilin-like [Watersipora subatra]|uniref:lebercilin-like n=1 Tax=Watersipora subatra TaxID=2589382 RepID=UPI00355BD091